MDTLSARSDEAPDASEIVRIWPGSGVPPGSETWTQTETTMQIPWVSTPRRLSRNVVVPTLTVFRPAPGKANGTAMVVAPGGAFHFLMVDHEGYDMARWLAGHGITAFVLKYRLGRTPDADDELQAFRTRLHAEVVASRKAGVDGPITREMWSLAVEDGRQAVRWVRRNASQYGLDPGRIGLGGFSAGGAVTLGVAFAHDAESRPDFTVPVYPPYRDLTVPANPPPMFLVISDDDGQVSPVAAARLYMAWHEAGAPIEFHVYGNGGHGWGMLKDGWLSDGWENQLERWLQKQGLL